MAYVLDQQIDLVAGAVAPEVHRRLHTVTDVDEGVNRPSTPYYAAQVGD